MRKIKFRGKTQDGKWVYGDLIHTNTDSIAILELDAPCLELVTDVVPDTIGQFTGLQDKNGNEIYEGDVVKNKEIGGYGWERLGVVRYYDKDCRFGIDITATNKFSTRLLFTEGECTINDGYCTIKYTNEYEVQGNIHDNPNLLKNGRD